MLYRPSSVGSSFSFSQLYKRCIAARLFQVEEPRFCHSSSSTCRRCSSTSRIWRSRFHSGSCPMEGDYSEILDKRVASRANLGLLKTTYIHFLFFQVFCQLDLLLILSETSNVERGQFQLLLYHTARAVDSEFQYNEIKELVARHFHFHFQFQLNSDLPLSLREFKYLTFVGIEN